MEKQTALKWFLSQMTHKFYISYDVIQKAIEMEKEQIENAYKRGKRHKKPLKDSNPINKYKSE